MITIPLLPRGKIITFVSVLLFVREVLFEYFPIPAGMLLDAPTHEPEQHPSTLLVHCSDHDDTQWNHRYFHLLPVDKRNYIYKPGRPRV